MKILLTGGCGYIGSHTCIELIKAGHECVIIDNLYNSKKLVLDRINEITGVKPKFYEGDILDSNLLDKIFQENEIVSVIHFAGLKAVGESVQKPLFYYKNNVAGTLTLLGSMKKNHISTIVFSSSATVYGDPKTVPIKEDFPVGATTNPYGTSKYMIENILKDLYKSDNSWNIALLRYFNPVGAHESGRIGEDPNGIPNNLMPYITQVAIGKRPYLNVFGSDYPTHDGSGIRDYIHVVDLAIGHVKAVEKLQSNPGLCIWNLGTGIGYSVIDVVKAFENASGKKIKYKVLGRRAGDIAECWADASKALKELSWKTERDLEQMCADSWRWQSQNPDGYK